MTAQVLGSLLPRWETQVEFWASGFSLAQPHLLQAIEMEKLSLSLLSNKRKEL